MRLLEILKVINYKCMKLKSLKIKKYKSIKEEVFDLDYKIESQTYSLIGINEAGKTSFLEAISFFDDKEKIIDKKFIHRDNNSSNKDIEIIFEYEECEDVNTDIKEKLKDKSIDESIINRVDIKSFIIKRIFKLGIAGVLEIEEIKFNDNLNDCIYNTETQQIVSKSKTENDPEVPEEIFDLKNCLINNFDLLNICYSYTHNILFWKSSNKYLIDQPVDLNAFKANPRDISIPLSNCFNLIGIEDKSISKSVDEILSDSQERKNFISRLETNVTNHIKNIWKEHKVKIRFDINSNLLTFLVEDDGVDHDNKTTDQRSDGFRQFISFLLSISAENKTGELQNYILLIDEPEQHLHPKAAEFLKEDLIKISSKKEDNNIVFFATHSLFMIDQETLERNYSVIKKENKETCIEKIDTGINTYSSIIYNVFEVYTNDYHNELVGWIQEEKKMFDSNKFNEYLKNNNSEIKPKYIEVKKDGTKANHKNIAISLYIRHQIHHPENKENQKFSKDDLIKSINFLVDLKNKIVNTNDKDLSTANQS